jgi:hypothetical protein
MMMHFGFLFMFLDAKLLSSGGAGGDTQSAPDKASCERRYPALTCNDLFDAA